LNIPAEIQTGTVLGPLLFLIFLNDVADNMTGFGRLFADDTCIGHMAHNEENVHTLISKVAWKFFQQVHQYALSTYNHC
jgi:hypothetical protein